MKTRILAIIMLCMACIGCTTHNTVGPVCIEGEVVIKPIKGRIEIIGQIRRAHDDEK